MVEIKYIRALERSLTVLEILHDEKSCRLSHIQRKAGPKTLTTDNINEARKFLF